MDDINILDKTKELRYVSVYNKLFKLINEGTFSENSRLPSEPYLAKELGVSRTTLRQALSLLQDDGLINNVRGKGNYITKKRIKKNKGLEKIGHIIYKCINKDITKVDMEFKLEPPSEYFLEILKEKTVATLSMDRWYLNNSSAIAYSFTIIPIEVISTLDIDLNHKDKLLEFIETDIYNQCSHSSIEIKFSSSGNFATKKYSISPEKHFYLIEEKIYKDSPSPMVINKHYLPIQYATIKLYNNK